MFLAFVVLFILKIRFPKGKSIKTIISRRYGPQVLQNFRKFEKSTYKLKKNTADLEFLNKCKIFNVIPKFLYFKLYNPNLLNSKLYKKWQHKLLNYEINTKQKQINKQQTLNSNHWHQLYQSVSFVDSLYLKNLVYKSTTNSISKVKQTHDKKLRNLGINNKISSLNPEKVIFNFSNRTLSNKEQSLLAFGLNFKIPIFNLNYFKYFLAFENLYKTLTNQPQYNENKNPPLKSTIKSIACRYFYNFKPYKIFSPIFNKSDIKTLRNLSNDSSIVICKPDKGNGIVILNKQDYISKMNNILNDISKFKKIDTDKLLYTLRQEDKLNRTIRQLKKDKILSETTANNILASGTNPGIMYGLPKIHKQNIPMRPILSANNTVSYNLSKYITSLLSHLTINDFTLKNSYDFANTIHDFPNASKHFMCSFDIQSLYTNIPLQETIDIIINKLFPTNNTIYKGYNKKQFETILNLSSKSSNFIFNNQLYEQIDGVAMGSPLGATLANIFLCHHENIWLNDCPTSYKPKLYRRYVDDTFLLFETEEQSNHFLSYLNTKHQNITFTKETEQNNQLPFLDITITKNNNIFETSIYRKPTFTGLAMNYLSSEPILYKLNAVRTLIYRAYHLSSTYINFNNEIKFLKTFFHNNCFPSHIIDTITKKFLSKIYNPTTTTTVAKQTIYISFPYLGYISDKIKNEITNLTQKRFPHLNLKIVFKNTFSIGSIFKHKEKLSKPLCSGIIYKYECLICKDQYIGSTIRQFQCRISEHQGISPRTNQPISTPFFSAIRQHHLDTGHILTQNSFDIMDKTIQSNLRTLEALYIAKYKPKLNTGLPVELEIP